MRWRGLRTELAQTDDELRKIKNANWRGFR